MQSKLAGVIDTGEARLAIINDAGESHVKTIRQKTNCKTNNHLICSLPLLLNTSFPLTRAFDIG
jgi:hypothetical protein